MKIYKISQSVNTNYDTFDSAIVVAKSAKEAKNINLEHSWGFGGIYMDWTEAKNVLYSTWCTDEKDVKVEYIGRAGKKYKKAAIILASFKAG